MEYYTRLERGNVGGVSESVVEGVAHALQLDEAERDHLLRLVRAAATRRSARRTPSRKRVRLTIQRMLDLMPMPAYLRNGRFDILAANELGRALYSPLYEESDTPNSARFIFLSSAAAEFFLDFDKVQDDAVAFLRAEAGRARTTRSCRTSSVSSRPEASGSGSAGRPTTSATTAPAPSGCTTRSSATSSWTSRPSSPRRRGPAAQRLHGPAGLPHRRGAQHARQLDGR